MKVPLGGGSLTTLASGQSSPFNIVLDSTSVYWANDTSNSTVMKVPIGGGTPTTLAGGQSYPRAIAVDSTSIYWTDKNNGSVDGTVMMAPK